MKVKDYLSKFGKVGILTGGNSSEREISLATAQSVERALKELNIDYSVILAEANFIDRLLNENIDIVFIAMHGGKGENGCIQGMLEMLGVPYTGSGVLASALCMNKALSKQVFEYHGLRTPAWHKVETIDEISLDLPIVVKPVSGGSTVATTIVREKSQLEEAFRKVEELVHTCDSGCEEGVLVEEYIPGREITVGILDGEPLPVLEIESMTEFYDYHAKYMPGMSRHYHLEDVGETLYNKIQDAAVKAFKVSGCRGMARVDFRLNDKDFYILEINTIPGLTQTSLLPEAAQIKGIDFPELIAKILKSATEKVFTT